MSSATFYELTYSDWLCDTVHAEFHYPETCAWHWETPCNICGPVNADSSGNGRVSFQEAFNYAYVHTIYSTPQISDQGGLAPDTYLYTEEEGEIVLPDDYTIVHGLLVSGGLEDLFYSDDDRLVVTHSGFWPPWIEVEVEGTAPSSSPSVLRFTFEGHVGSSNVDQRISMFNYDTQDWEEVDHRFASTSDETIDVVISDNPSRFIDPNTLEMKTQMKWMGTGFTSLYGWNAEIDQTIWTIAP
jgi:hypothetical protein